MRRLNAAVALVGEVRDLFIARPYRIQNEVTSMPGNWQPLANQPPFAASTMLLLTDGTVMCILRAATTGGN